MQIAVVVVTCRSEIPRYTECIVRMALLYPVLATSQCRNVALGHFNVLMSKIPYNNFKKIVAHCIHVRFALVLRRLAEL